MAANPLLRLHEFGQSVWLDYIQRELIENGGLERLIREDGLAGVTSNPAICGPRPAPKTRPTAT